MEIFRYLLGTRAPAAPKSVLAFSTIITMLTHTNRGQRLDNFGSPKEIGLGVLDALAVVIATGFEVVAVTSKDHNNPRHLEVVACIGNGFVEDFTPKRNYGPCQRIVNALVNSRGDGQIPTADIPTIVEPDPPSYLGDISQIEDYIQEP